MRASLSLCWYNLMIPCDFLIKFCCSLNILDDEYRENEKSVILLLVVDGDACDTNDIELGVWAADII